LDEAQIDIQDALEHWPDDADLHYLNALVLIKKEKFEEAEKEAQSAIAIDNGHANAISVLAESYRRMGDLKRALQIWERFMTLEPRNLYGLLALIELYSSEHCNVQARASLSRLIKLSGHKSLDEVIAIANQDQELLPYRPNWDVLRNAIGMAGGWR
jgi:tetratricopeptide (TPR) repeat protein